MVGSCPSPHWIVRNILSLYIIAKYCLRAELGQIVEKKTSFCLGLPSFPMVPNHLYGGYTQVLGIKMFHSLMGTS